MLQLLTPLANSSLWVSWQRQVSKRAGGQVCEACGGVSSLLWRWPASLLHAALSPLHSTAAVHATCYSISGDIAMRSSPSHLDHSARDRYYT